MKQANNNEETAAANERPGAPALEKGLDLLEALADEPEGLTQKALAERVSRSVSEIFRMLGVLEQRGYVRRDPLTNLYALTLRMFELANRHPPMRRLQRAALHTMERLADTIGHSCHLVAMNGDRMMVISQAEPQHRAMGWSVKLGASFALSSHYASARVIAAFQQQDRQLDMVKAMAEHDGSPTTEKIMRRLAAIAEAGNDVSSSEASNGVIDISFPVLNHFNQAVAALTVPFMSHVDGGYQPQDLVPIVGKAAREISVAIGAMIEE
ncbi:IclR family transcriptional regulator [Herbaspirillum chlorophenolicum]|uniref:IclR family transcriptional regulator n=1 Tax=Herbaspirillum chlorophenolicum TaxID=211589 RepID=UPI00067DF61D|nr:IclR family transcriptional regulator [Herbaspirillum chlorophenolicum]